MHVVLLLLKIIGIILAVLLGIFLLLVLTVLLVPIRYRFKADNLGEIHGEGRITWLLRFISVKGLMDKGTFLYSVRIFGFLIKTNGERKERKGPSQKSRKIPKQKHKEEKEKPKNIGIETKPGMDGPAAKEGKKEAAAEEKRETPENPKEAAEDQNHKDEKEKPGKNRFFVKIRELRQTIRNKIKQTREGIKSIFQRIGAGIGKGKRAAAFFTRKENRPGFLVLLQSVKKVLKHLGPAKINGRVKFGTGDPCSTGQALGVLSLFYAYYGESVTIIPDFEEKILEAEIWARGRIRLGTLLALALQLWLHKDFKAVVEDFKQLKEEL